MPKKVYTTSVPTKPMLNKFYSPKLYKFFVSCCVCVLCSFTPLYALENEKLINKGVYDASELLNDGIVTLEGEWVFVPQHFVNPKEDFSKFKRYEDISTSWSSHEVQGADLSYATYSVKITGLSLDATYAIKSSECISACTAYINGEEFFHAGKVGKSKEEEEPCLDATFAILPPLTRRNIVLVFHISNFHNRYSSFQKPIKFGHYSVLKEEKHRETVRFAILAGHLTILAAFFISLYIFYTRSKLSLYFGLICANFGVRICCYDEFLINYIFPFLGYNAVFKMGYVTFSLAILLVTLFLQRLFRMTQKIVLVFLCLPFFCYLLINIFASTYVSSFLLVYALMYALFLALYNVVLVLIKSIKKNRTAFLFLFGLLLLFVATIYDILIANRIIEGQFIAHFGVLAMLIPMGIIIFRSFKLSSDRLSLATSNIDGLNLSLSRFLPYEFAHFLQKQHTEIKLGDNVLKEMYIVFIHLNICNKINDEILREKALATYNLALSYINPIIEYHHGFVDKYMPEGLMILFEKNIEDVINCMLQIHLVVQQKNIERALREEDEFVISTGIHYGKVMIGTIGEAERMDNTVISDAVNITSRLHSYALNENISIAVSQIVKDNFEDDIREKPVSFYYKGRVQLKGKTEEVEVYEVIRE